jgi:TolB-like protein/Flp pilus assembly protein TadD
LYTEYVSGRGGRIVNAPGDSILAEFPAALNAVDCAVAIQKAVAERNADLPESRRMRFRIGVNLGDVLVDDAGLYGDGVNIAARLESLAAPGRICVSKAVRDHVGSLPGLEFEDMGGKQVKNIAQPVHVYGIRAEGDPPRTALAVPSPPSVAVLPFVNLTRDEENEYFADGLSEELLNVLAKIQGLRVASRTSAFSFKGKNVEVGTVAQKLNVANILEGSVRKSGNRVRINAQLIQVATETNLWSGAYERELDDIFAVQDDIAQSVVKELRRALLLEAPDTSEVAQIKAEVAGAAKGRSQNVEAYKLYLQGQFFRELFTQADCEKAVQCYLQAIQLDPSYALAWAGLSRAYADQAGQCWVPSADGFARAKAAAQRAIAREPELGEAHAALGWLLIVFDWDWKGAEATFRRALELSPGSTLVLSAAANLFGSLGRLEAAIELSHKAAALDPLNVTVHCNLGMYYLAAGRLDEAEAVLKKVLQIGPSGGLAYVWLGVLALARDRPEEALELMDREVNELYRLVGVAVAHHALGQRDESEAALAQLIRDYQTDSQYQIATVYAACGDADKAFEWLELAYVARDPGLSWLRKDPFLLGIRGDRRWQPLLQKMGLADG